MDDSQMAKLHLDSLRATVKKCQIRKLWTMIVYVYSGLKKITSIHDWLTIEMNRFFEDTDIAEWMTNWKIILINKVPPKNPAPNNYTPKTFLDMMWRTLTAKIWEEIYYSLISHGLFHEEQKGCRKGTEWTGELLWIDQHILKESKIRPTNLAMLLIDYKKKHTILSGKGG